MSIFDVIIGIVVPHTCLGCGREGQLLCPVCLERLPVSPERCYRCQTASEEHATCAACRRAGGPSSVRVATVYDGTAKALIWQLKLGGARAAARLMARQLAPLIKENDPRTVIVPVPTASGRVRQRGYDQAKLLGRELARQTRFPYGDWLVRRGQTHQHGLSRRERLAQLRSAAFHVRPRILREAPILLVDDVLTTGATLEAAALALRAAGATDLRAAVFARP